MPAMKTSGFGAKPNRVQRAEMVLDKDSPSSSGGRPITTRRAPAFLAADSFSSNPPGAPPSFVTRYCAPMLRSIAVFMASENGPCIAKMCEAGSPACAHASRDDCKGSTRAQTRSEKPGSCENFASSLLPVVSRILPSVPARNAAASETVST